MIFEDEFGRYQRIHLATTIISCMKFYNISRYAIKEKEEVGRSGEVQLFDGVSVRSTEVPYTE